jgi:hypothetical protein
MGSIQTNSKNLNFTALPPPTILLTLFVFASPTRRVKRSTLSPHFKCYVSKIGADCSKLLDMKTILKLPALFQIEL